MLGISQALLLTQIDNNNNNQKKTAKNINNKKENELDCQCFC